jgi:hypothetical protein
MSEVIGFFQQYESVIYFLLAVGLVVYAWKFYQAWQELRGSVFGLEQVGAQRRLNRSTVAIFFTILVGVGVFSLVTFGQSLVDNPALSGDLIPFSGQDTSAAMDEDETGGEADPLASATPLPTVAIDPVACDPESVNISAPAANEEIRGEYDVTGLVNVENFSYYVFEIASPDKEIWETQFVNRTAPPPEETVLFTWDTSLISPGNYVLQLRVGNNDTEYPPCRIPITVGRP